MFQMNANRLLIFITVLLVVFFALQNCWQGKPLSEKWLYMNEGAARDYAGQVLGPGRGAKVPIPGSLSQTLVTTYDTYVTFSPKDNPRLVLAFSPDVEPPQPRDPALAGRHWLPLRDSWYLLKAAPAGGR